MAADPVEGAGWVRPLPAALVLGIVSGVLAGFVAIVACIPLLYSLRSLEVWTSTEQLRTAAALADGDLDAHAIREAGSVDSVMRIDGAGAVVEVSGQSIQGLVGLPCSALPAELDGWLIACRPIGDQRVWVAKEIGGWYGAAVAIQVLGGALVALLTTLGVSRVLQPISDVGAALSRIERGERGVSLPRSRLKELDDLVTHVNATARAMDDREDAIGARLRTVHDLARMVAHEVRNPLQTLELLTSLIAGEEDQRERELFAASIHAEIRALDAVVQRVLRDGLGGATLTIHRIRRSAVPLIDQVVSLQRAHAGRRGVKIVRGEVSYRPVMLDPALIGRSLENLVLNAIQAFEGDDGLVVLSAKEEPPFLILACDDNGPGVDPDLGKSIFETNVSTKKTGSGLGLALVRGVVEAHGGYVDYHRSELGGARFELRLPMISGESGEYTAVAHPGGG